MNVSLTSLPFGVALAATIVLMLWVVWLLSAVAPRLGLMDYPSARKIHAEPVPVVGGVALFLVLALVSAIQVNAIPLFVWPLLASSVVLVGVGLLDDRHDLSPLWRFVAQGVAIALVIGLTGVRIDSFGFLLSDQWPVQLGWLAVSVTLFGVIGIINAINMADGIDGLAAALVLVPLFFLWMLVPEAEWKQWLSLLMVALGVFVIFNLFGGRKRIFLGDAGSLFLGFVLGWLVVYFSQGNHRVIYPVTALWLLALPVFDTIFVMTRRIQAGRSPFSPDQRHLHHFLMRQGHSARKTLAIIVVYALILAQVGILMLHYAVPEHWQFYAFVALSGVYYFALWYGWQQVDARQSSPDTHGVNRGKGQSGDSQ